MITVRSEHARDVKAREILLDEAFGLERYEKTCERLREGRVPARGLSLVAESEGRIIGTVRLWHVAIGSLNALLLGPLAVTDNCRAQGIGARLIRTALNRAAMQGHQAIILVGDAPYYARFGFSADVTTNIDLPGPVDRKRFLGLELKDDAFARAQGVVVATGEAIPTPSFTARKARPRVIAQAA
ncbi:MAG: N-acetyltransferase [Alphaproteobacteria bacterium]